MAAATRAVWARMWRHCQNKISRRLVREDGSRDPDSFSEYQFEFLHLVP